MEKLQSEVLRFREEVKNPKGLRPIPITLDTGKIIDWNMLARNEKQVLKKAFKKRAPKILEKIQRARKIKIYCEPIKENVYFCDECNKTHVAHLLDEGATPAFITCHNCKHPQARSLAFEIPDSYKNASPDIVFRYSTKDEYAEATEALQEYLEQGGLYMEIVK